MIFNDEPKRRMSGVNPSTPLLRVDPDRGLTPPNGSTLIKLDWFRLTLVYTSPALNTVLGMDGIWFIFLHFIDFTGTDFGTVSTATAFFAVYHWVHNQVSIVRIISALISEIPNYRSQISNKFQVPISKWSKLKWARSLNSLLHALCPMRFAVD